MLTCIRLNVTGCSGTSWYFWHTKQYRSIWYWTGGTFAGVFTQDYRFYKRPFVNFRISMEAWYLDTTDEDQRKPHRLNPNEPVSLDELKKLGVFHWKLNTDIYESDPELEQIRKEQGYSYMDIITIHRDKLPNYEEKLKMFFEEHLHLDDEIRYILDGQAYFDIRDKEDRWIRIAMKKGDLISLPAGIYHRFTVDNTNYTKAMRLFVGEPVWKAYNRPADDFEIRQKYMASLQGS